MLARVYKCQEGHYIDLSQGNLSPKVSLPLDAMCLLKQNLIFRTKSACLSPCPESLSCATKLPPLAAWEASLGLVHEAKETLQ